MSCAILQTGSWRIHYSHREPGRSVGALCLIAITLLRIQNTENPFFALRARREKGEHSLVTVSRLFAPACDSCSNSVTRPRELTVKDSDSCDSAVKVKMNHEERKLYEAPHVIRISLRPEAFHSDSPFSVSNVVRRAFKCPR
jgi:hypothetical protein